MKALRTFFLTFLGTLGIAAIVGAGSFYYLYRWAETPRNIPVAKVIPFPHGTSLRDLAQQLETAGVTDHHELFWALVRLDKTYGRFQAGQYRFEGQVSPRDIIGMMISGRTYNPIVVQFTIPEGFNLKQIIARLVENRIGTAEELGALARNKQFLAEKKIPGNSFEGFFYPATYQYIKIPTPREVFTDAARIFYENLPPNYEADAKALGLSLERAVTFASMIELETANPDEKPIVSEVIWTRLKAGTPLGIDAALIYGIQDYRGNIGWKHLKDKSNLYNTRVYPGLPPSPIGSPTAVTLNAVLHPTQFGYWYYVLDAEHLTEHRHHFSKSLREHQQYVKMLVDATRKRGKNVNSGSQ